MAQYWSKRVCGGVVAGLSLAWGAHAADASDYQALKLRPNDVEFRAAPRLAAGSHLRVYLPSMAYAYISHAINGALIRPANNLRGWEFDFATGYKQISDTVYEFSLRKDTAFQDGSPFNADSVVLNIRFFKRRPYLFSKLHEVLSHVEKIDDYTVRFHLSEKYGTFLNDLVWLQFYAPDYLYDYGWNGKPSPPNLSAPGPYGLGPYQLESGYAEGDRQSPVVELVANPHYWDPRYPLIERVTVYTDLGTAEAREKALYSEGEIDISPLEFEYKLETILSPHAKLVISPSTSSYPIHINMITGHPRLREVEVRLALNQALHQANLLYFTYDHEGEMSPALVAPEMPGVREAMRKLKPYSELSNPYDPETQARLRKTLDGLELRVLTQQQFMFLWRSIEYQLQKVGVKLLIEVVAGESELLAQLHAANLKQNDKAWDLLVWNADDWFFNHPWSAFLVFRTHSYWSTISPDPVLDGYIEDMFATGVNEPGYEEVIFKIMHHAYNNAYMLFVPTPNKVLAVNKEVIFTPYKQGVLPLWEIGLTRQHVSVRQSEYPPEYTQPFEIVRKNFE